MIGIRWTLENFSKLHWDSDMIGPDFYLKPECIFNISLNLDDKNLHVCVYNVADAKITFQRKISFFDYNNMKLHEENDATIFTLETDEDKDVISNLVERERFNNLPNDTLIIDLYLNIKEVLTQNLNPLECHQGPEKKPREDLKMTLENPVSPDVSLEIGEERIAAHWSILCSRSPYFKKMFESGRKESVQNSVTISDISFSTLKKLIQFLYASVFIQGDDNQELFELYYAAHKYEVMDLRALCGRKIVSIATTENVTEILEYSLHTGDKALKIGAIDFIRWNSDIVYQTESWKDFEKRVPGISELIRICLRKN